MVTIYFDAAEREKVMPIIKDAYDRLCEEGVKVEINIKYKVI